LVEKYLLNRDDTKAGKILENLIKKYPKYYKLWLLNGIVKCRLNKYKQAIICFNKVITLKKSLEEAWGLLTLTYLNLNNIKKAKKILEEAEHLNPLNKKIQFYSKNLIKFYFSIISI